MASPDARSRLRAELLQLEVRLLDAAVRRDPSQTGHLLHPRFREIGASGRWWTREDIIQVLAEEGSVRPPMPVVHVAEFEVELIDDRHVLATFRTTASGGRVALRTSLWEFGDSGWQLRFHQGTPVQPIAAPKPEQPGQPAQPAHSDPAADPA